MAKLRQPVGTKRRIPRQARAAETVAAILEATAQILEKGGLVALTTNAVAERAGVSVGTLYQYFDNKDALLLALAQQETEATLADVARALKGEIDPSPQARVRAMVRVLVNAFGGRRRARKAVMLAILTQGAAPTLMAPVVAFVAEQGSRVGQAQQAIFSKLTPEQVFVLSRATMGIIRTAVLEEQPFLTSPTFEDEIVRLVLAYLTAIMTQSAARG
ncbi:MAG: TetR/AcrR family transcriptional regulator [Alphaproteobacteria bacterium]|nr:TetR/AcrR family transcriptional regulator [Alphaproteobacteria bacterium]